MKEPKDGKRKENKKKNKRIEREIQYNNIHGSPECT